MNIRKLVALTFACLAISTTAASAANCPMQQKGMQKCCSCCPCCGEPAKPTYNE